MIKTKSESQMQQMLEQSVEDDTCILDGSLFKSADLLVDLSETSEVDGPAAKRWKHYNKKRIVKPGDEGLYSLIFARCEPSSGASVSFKLNAAFWNPGPNYLSACEVGLLRLSVSLCIYAAICPHDFMIFDSPAVAAGGAAHAILHLLPLLLRRPRGLVLPAVQRFEQCSTPSPPLPLPLSLHVLHVCPVINAWHASLSTGPQYPQAYGSPTLG